MWVLQVGLNVSELKTRDAWRTLMFEMPDKKTATGPSKQKGEAYGTM